MITDTLDIATHLQKEVQSLVSEVRKLRSENELLKVSIEKLKSELTNSSNKKTEYKNILDNNALVNGLEKKEDIIELRLRINEIIRELDSAILYMENINEYGK